MALKLKLCLALCIGLIGCPAPTAPKPEKKKPPVVSVHAGKMNVLYIGVDNPIVVDTNADGELDVKIKGPGAPQLIKSEDGGYIAQVTQTGDVQVRVTGEGFQTMHAFRVKRMPTPVVRLGGKTGGTMTVDEFKTQTGVTADLEGFDFKAKCSVYRMLVSKMAPRQDAAVASNAAPRFTGGAKKLIERAQPNDLFLFEGIRVRCPGDKDGRPVGPMVFRIR